MRLLFKRFQRRKRKNVNRHIAADLEQIASAESRHDDVVISAHVELGKVQRVDLLAGEVLSDRRQHFTGSPHQLQFIGENGFAFLVSQLETVRQFFPADIAEVCHFHRHVAPVTIAADINGVGIRLIQILFNDSRISRCNNSRILGVDDPRGADAHRDAEK